MEQKSETKFLRMIPVLASSDVKRDIDWFENKLGIKNGLITAEKGESKNALEYRRI